MASMIRQAVILAGGAGNRMKKSDPSAGSIPKPLLEVGGVSIIERVIRKLAERDTDIAVVINKKDDSLFRKKLGAYDIEYLYQQERLGTANALYSAKEFIRDALFLVMMGDDVTEYSAARLLSIDEPTVFGFEVDDVSRFGAVVADANNEVEDILEKKASGKGIANTGVYVMPRMFFEIYNEIPKDEKSGEYFLTHVPRIMKRHGVMFRLRKIDYWFGINTREELREADEALKGDTAE